MDYTDVRRQWAERSGEYSPEYYAHYGPDETSESVLAVVDRHVGTDAAVLELGCSSGRHLARFREAGYDDLSGVEVNGDAFDVMAEAHPDLAADGSFYHDAIEDVVREFDDGQFDVVFAVETLQHLHPSVEWVFAELARVTGTLLVTVENEGDGHDEFDPEQSHDVSYVNDDFPLYHRDWRGVFTDLGLAEVAVETGVGHSGRDTLRAFGTR